MFKYCTHALSSVQLCMVEGDTEFRISFWSTFLSSNFRLKSQGNLVKSVRKQARNIGISYYFLLNTFVQLVYIMVVLSSNNSHNLCDVMRWTHNILFVCLYQRNKSGSRICFTSVVPSVHADNGCTFLRSQFDEDQHWLWLCRPILKWQSQAQVLHTKADGCFRVISAVISLLPAVQPQSICVRRVYMLVSPTWSDASLFGTQ